MGGEHADALLPLGEETVHLRRSRPRLERSPPWRIRVPALPDHRARLSPGLSGRRHVLREPCRRRAARRLRGRPPGQRSAPVAAPGVRRVSRSVSRGRPSALLTLPDGPVPLEAGDRERKPRDASSQPEEGRGGRRRGGRRAFRAAPDGKRAESRPLARGRDPLPRRSLSRCRRRGRPRGSSGGRPQDPGGAVRGKQHNGPVTPRLLDRGARRETGAESGRIHPGRRRGGEAIRFRDLVLERLSAPERLDLRRGSALREGAGSASPSQHRRLLHGGPVGASDWDPTARRSRGSRRISTASPQTRGRWS